MQDWLKLHTDLLDNPDVALISPLDFQIFTFLMLLCRREGITDGRLVGWDYPRLSYRLRKTVVEIENSVTRLKRDDVHWLDLDENGVICIVNYGVRQYGKLSATPEKVRERVKRLRNRGNDTELEPVTPVSRDGNAPVTRSNAVDKNRVEENRKETTSGADAPIANAPPETKLELPKAINRRQTIINDLEAAFSGMTGIQPPKRSTQKQTLERAERWWNPLGVILDLTDGDAGKTKALIRASVDKLRGNQMTFDAPASIVKTARSIQANGTNLSPKPTLRGPNE